ncbi:MAG TPA: efflux RND transporter periplasmic adaptor subunit [Bacillota bacterium]|nr:efflux RND transporter periplasmic adaptor subunit [Bacillota bacterium]
MKKIHLLAIMILGVVLLVACNDDDDEKVEEDPVVPIEVTEATTGNITDDQTVYGRTSPIKTTPVTINAPGEVDQVEVKNGETVEKDDLIAKIKTQAGTVNVNAPADGEIAKFSAKEGDIVSNEDPLAVILDTEDMEIIVGVTSNVRALFKQDKEYDAEIGDKTYKAVVETIDSLPNDTGLYDILFTVENEDNKITAGDIAGVIVSSTAIKDALILPTEAIIEESEGAYVYLIEDDQAKKVDVEVLEMRSDFAAIEADIEEGDQVAINGQLTLEDGSQVEVVKAGNES